MYKNYGALGIACLIILLTAVGFMIYFSIAEDTCGFNIALYCAIGFGILSIISLGAAWCAKQQTEILTRRVN